MRIFFLALLLGIQTLLAQSPEVAFTIKEKDFFPEGMAYDHEQRTFFLGSIHKKKIAQITFQGTTTDFIPSGKHGLLQVLGMKAAAGKLWVCNNSPASDSIRISNVHVFDLKTGSLLRKLTLSDQKKHLFNDIVVDSKEIAYVTDTEAGAIYRIRKESSQIDELVKAGTLLFPNGIVLDPDEQRLIVATDQGIMSVDVTTSAITPVKHWKFGLSGIDGLYFHNGKLIGIQNVSFPEAIIEMTVLEGFTGIKKIRSLCADHPVFDSPTTGTIVGNYFYFIANSQLLQIIGNNGKIRRPGELKEVVIMKMNLD